MSYPVGSNEAERLASLDELGIVGSTPDPTFHRITKLTAEMFRVSTAIITFVGKDECFKTCEGLSGGTTPRSQAFCNHTILSDEILVVEDATADERFRDNPLVVGEPGIRFYAGVPLALDAGRRLGALCLIDTVPRSMSAEDRTRLCEMADIVVAVLQLHRSRNEAKVHRDALAASEERLRIAVETTGLGSWEYEGTKAPLEMSSESLTILGFPPGARVDWRALLRCVHHQDRHRLLSEIGWAGAAPGRSLHLDLRVIRATDREERWLSVRGRCFERRRGLRLLGTLNDITELQVRAQQQQGLALLGQIALREGNLDELLRACCDVLVRTLGADCACVATAASKPAGKRLTVVAGAGRLYPEVGGALVDMEASLLHRAFGATRPVAVVDATMIDEEWRAEVGVPFGLHVLRPLNAQSADKPSF